MKAKTGKAIGLIGNDAEAATIAARLAQDGWRVLHHITGVAYKPERSANLEAAATPADIAIECTIVLIAIDDTALVRKILFGTPERLGILAEMTPGTVLIDLGVRRPREAQGLLGVTGTRGVAIVDAALVGSVEATRNGTAMVLLGGYPDSADIAEPILASLGRVERTGPLGSAQTAAALMGYVEVAHNTARSEALTFGAALGLSGATLDRFLKDKGEPSNVVRLHARADLACKLTQERGITAEVIDLRRVKSPAGPADNR